MPRKPDFKASGKNDVWLIIFFIAAVVVAGLVANARDSDAPGRPTPAPASSLKE